MKGITFSSVKMNCGSSVMMGCYKTTGGTERSTRERSATQCFFWGQENAVSKSSQNPVPHPTQDSGFSCEAIGSALIRGCGPQNFMQVQKRTGLIQKVLSELGTQTVPGSKSTWWSSHHTLALAYELSDVASNVTVGQKDFWADLKSFMLFPYIVRIHIHSTEFLIKNQSV